MDVIEKLQGFEIKFPLWKKTLEREALANF